MSKNTSSKSPTYAQKIGLCAEENVIKLLISKNWSLCYRRLKTKIAEIDLVFEKTERLQTEVLLIEVKRLNESWRAFERIHSKQLIKLQKNFILFSATFKNIKFRSYVAWVDPQNKITFVEIF